MTNVSSEERAELVELVRRLMSGGVYYPTEDAQERAAAELTARVPHPAPTDLIFYWESEFDHEPTPEEIVDRALSYRPIAL
jgi:hypothetical protein